MAITLMLVGISCASPGSKPKPATASEPAEITEENPGYYEPELHKKYRDKRYEEDEEFKDYYEWKKK